MRPCRILIALVLFPVFVQVALAQEGAAAPPSDASLTIDTTAGLFGYFRLPNYQNLDSISDLEKTAPQPGFFCPSAANIASPDAQVFFGHFHASGNRLLVGTGDNFAPNYGSRMFADDPRTLSKTIFADGHQEKELYNWDWALKEWTYYDGRHWDSAKHEWVSTTTSQGDDTVPTDNVACFLSYAGYAAIVPGKHDFQYGAERLRALARLLASIDQAGFSRVQMLGANIVIKVAWTQDHKPLALTQKAPPLNFSASSDDWPDSIAFDEFTDGGSVYPWLQIIPVLAKRGSNVAGDYEFSLCRANAPNPDELFDAQGKCLHPVVSGMKPTPENSDLARERGYKHPASVTPSATSQATHLELDLNATKELDSGKSYAICAKYIGTARAYHGKNYCKQFATYIPFFEYQTATHASGPVPQKPARYVIRTLSNGEKVVIFGVVDPSMGEHVGAGNLAWDLYDKRDHEDLQHTARVTFADPEKALEQDEEFFEKKNPDFHGFRLLLAEMEPTVARAFAARLPEHLRFNVVITQGDDDEATPNETVAYSAANARNIQPSTLIVVPPRHDKSTSSGDRLVHVREVRVMSNDEYEISGVPMKVPVANTQEQNNLGNQAFTALVNAAWPREFPGTSPSGDWTQDFPKIALNAIRKQEHADAALLQTRDIFNPVLSEFVHDHCQTTPSLAACQLEIAQNFEELIDRILWKGDFVRTISVKGSVLAQVLDQSAKFKQTDDSCCQLVAEPRRDIVALGIIKDQATGSYTINRGPLDPNALYTIAASDYIALGDTGYPDLATPPVGDPPSPFTHDTLELISSTVCEEFRKDLMGHSPVLTLAPCSGDIPPYTGGNSYYDTVHNMPMADPRLGLTSGEQLKLWSFLHDPLGRTPAPKVVPETLVEERPQWEFSTDALAIGFAGVSHNGNEAALTNNFGGVLDPQVNSKRSRSLSFNVSTKASRYTRAMDWFVSTAINYQQQTIAQTSGSSSETQQANAVVLEFGTYLHARHTQKLPNLYWGTYGHFETELANPITTLKTPSVTFEQGRTNLLLARTGPRWQNRKSFAELGFEGGSTLNAIQGFNILSPASGTLLLSCADTSTSLQQCITNSGLSIPTNADFTTVRHPLTRTGVYWKFGLVVPLWSSVSYTFNEASDYFFNSSGDNSANTKYRHQIDQSLAFQFATWPSLSVQPSLTLFFYENKVAYNTLFQQQYSIKINYSFDWTNKHAARDQLTYKKPSASQ